MPKIIGIGETVFDIIFKDGQPQAAKAGGSVLNAMVSLGRTGLPVYFISEYGQDDVGGLIDAFLSGNNINTGYVYRFDEDHTALALAFLDEKNDAHYSFYRNLPKSRDVIHAPDIGPGDIILCGSFYAIAPEIREGFLRFIQGARDQGALVLYDPNFRKSHLHQLDQLKPLIIENMKIAGLVRGSDEDFHNIFGARNPDEAYQAVSQYCDYLVYTANIDGVYVKTPSFSGRFPVKKITPVSTIGAGDNFNAGMIAAFYRKGQMGQGGHVDLRDWLERMGEKEWAEVIESGVDYATEVCLGYENYVSREFAESVRREP